MNRSDFSSQGIATPIALSNQRIFDGVEKKEFALLAPRLLYKVKKGKEIPLSLEQYGRMIYIIQSGYVTVYSRTKFQEYDAVSNKEQPTFSAWRGKGQMIGDGVLMMAEIVEGKFPVEQYPSAASVTVKATDECTLIGFSVESFRKLVERNSVIYRNLARCNWDKLLRERIRTQIIQTKGKSALPRVARTLLRLEEARKYRGDLSDMLKGSIYTEDIAGYIGITLETASEQLRMLRRVEAITYEGNALRDNGEIRIINLDILIYYCNPSHKPPKPKK